MSFGRTVSFCVVAVCIATLVSAANPAADPKQTDSKEKDKPVAAPAKKPAPQAATPVDQLKVHKDFKVELLYSVPKGEQGSWVNMCVDPKGRLIVSDQYGSLYRVTPPAVGQTGEAKVEKIPADMGEGQGLLWANDALYVMVNRGRKYASGLYRVTSSKNDDTLDKVEKLIAIDGGGEHGPHAILLSPDKKSLYLVCGDGTKLFEPETSRVPRIWGEDHLLPRMPDGNGFMANVLAPGGFIMKTDFDGKHGELICTGFRNQFDAAFNKDGELFTYDADMEWDFNTPWYRPTRICHCTSGAEFGWRNGAGKWPEYYADSLPPVYNVGPGSPTGMTFGYGAKFPAKYQDALFMCDWSYGKLYAAHLAESGSTYTATLEEFVTGTPLPLTDVVVNPTDGALYFTIGGRTTQSGLYRVTYAGNESTAPAMPVDVAHGKEQPRDIRHKLEEFHLKQDPAAIEAAWPHLGDADRFIRFAARVAIEHQDPALWESKVFEEKNPHAQITALLALVRVKATDPFHRKPGDPAGNPDLEAKVIAALDKIDWAKLNYTQKMELLRTYAVTFNRCGKPSEEIRQKSIARFDAIYPAAGRELNADLSNLMVYLQAPTAAEKTVKLLTTAPTQEEQIEYARALRMLKEGWAPEQRKAYFQWFVKAANYKGGNSFGKFVANIKRDAVASLTDAEKKELQPIIDAKPESAVAETLPPRPFVKSWTMADVEGLAEKGLKNRDFDHGRKMFAAAKCFACHRYDNEGGANGPDLTSAAGRFNKHDLIESIVLPSAVISDQYAAMQFRLTDGRVVTGRVINYNGNNMSVNTDMLNPNALTDVDRNKVEEMMTSKVSMMPEGLLNTFNDDEILDLLAYLLSRGDRENAMFQKGK